MATGQVSGWADNQVGSWTGGHLGGQVGGWVGWLVGEPAGGWAGWWVGGLTSKQAIEFGRRKIVPQNSPIISPNTL